MMIPSNYRHYNLGNRETDFEYEGWVIYPTGGVYTIQYLQGLGHGTSNDAINGFIDASDPTI